MKIGWLAFDDIAEHDFAWGAFRTPYGGGVTVAKRAYLQAIVAQGLAELHPLLNTIDYWEREKVVNPGKRGPAAAFGKPDYILSKVGH